MCSMFFCLLFLYIVQLNESLIQVETLNVLIHLGEFPQVHQIPKALQGHISSSKCPPSLPQYHAIQRTIFFYMLANCFAVLAHIFAARFACRFAPTNRTWSILAHGVFDVKTTAVLAFIFPCPRVVRTRCRGPNHGFVLLCFPEEWTFPVT